MKIVHVIASTNPRGGGPIQGAISQSLVWRENGHEAVILSLDQPDAPWLEDSNIPTFPVGAPGRTYKWAKWLLPWLRYSYTPGLSKWFDAHAKEYDAVIVHGLWNYSSYGTWRALRAQNIPYFVFTHGMLSSWFKMTFPLKHRFKCLFWRLFEHKVIRNAACVFFTTDEERRLASQTFTPYQCREHVVGFGTHDIGGDAEIQISSYLDAVPRVRGRKIVLFLGRINPVKGIDLLLQAFSRLAHEFPQYDLVIAGPDQARTQARLQALSLKLGIARRVHWPGMLNGEKKWGAFRSADYFVLPSHQENFGVVVAEALALSKPVLITNKVNIWKDIEADKAGCVVNDDADAIAAGLRKMCSLSEEEHSKMSKNARMCYLQRYNVEKSALYLVSVIENLLKSMPKETLYKKGQEYSRS